MSEKLTYYDIRSEFWEKHWEMAKDYEEFLKNGDQTFANRWKDFEKRIPHLSEEQLKRIQGYNRIVNVLLYGGIWCGDCFRQGPIIKKIVDSIGDKVNLKIIDREESEELKDELRILGATRVPVVIFLTEDFWEITRYGERTLSVYRAKAAREIGKRVNVGILSPKAIKIAVNEWLDIFERILIMTRLAPPLRKKYND
jgi:thiol-disulfide isomerase/thioredoxin